MATTPNGLIYPTDYADPADSPAALEDLAISADTAISARALASRQVIAGNGLTGGGTLQTDRTINVAAGSGISVSADAVAVDYTTLDARYALATRQMIAGNGLTGGGTLAADRTMNVGAGSGITVSADAVAVDYTVLDARYALATRQVIAGNGLTGGGTLAADRTMNVVGGNGITVTADAVAVNYAAFDGRYARVYVQSTQPSAGNIGDIWVPT